jgi:hypothetical protein
VCRGRARRAGVSSSCKSPAFGAPVSETPLLDEQYILCLSIDTSHTLLPFHSNRLLLSIPVPPPCQYLPQPITTLLLTGYHARMHMLRLTRSLSLSLYMCNSNQPTSHSEIHLQCSSIPISYVVSTTWLYETLLCPLFPRLSLSRFSFSRSLAMRGQSTAVARTRTHTHVTIARNQREICNAIAQST